MHTLRAPISVAVVLALLGGLSTTAAAQSGRELVTPPAEFSGRLACPDHVHEGKITNVVVGPIDEGNLVRRETRGGSFRFSAEAMSDPRFDGTWSAYVDTDEYIYPGVDMQDHATITAVSQRIENDEGAWQGSAPDGYVPEAPMTTWGLLVLTGEDTYEGLTALQWTNLVDDTCSCMNPDNLCEWDIRGLVFEGEMPPVPLAD